MAKLKLLSPSQLKRDFEIFRRTFLSYQKRFGLTDYRIVFKHEPLDGNWAELNTDHMGRVATARLNAKPDPERLDDYDPARHAKHEACHLLIGRMFWLGRCRYVTESELQEEDEALVRKLENLIP